MDWSTFEMLPHAGDILEHVRAARAASGHLFLGLDYDGTLTGIVPIPDEAHLTDPARDVLRQLADREDTMLSILTGRSLSDIRGRVGLGHAFYAGNHGLEIDGPGVHRVHEAAAAIEPTMSRIARALEADVRGSPGTIVEDKGVTLSLHYRTAPEAEHARIRDVAQRIGGGEAGVRLTHGKRVVEIRPDVDWHKGAALQFLRGTLPDPDAPAVFIGDDLTDEDAFRALPPGGWGILVAERITRETAANAVLRTPAEVLEWLAALAA